MKNAIIFHGTCDEEEYYDDAYPSLSNSHWIPWLQKQLLIKHIAAATPEIANAYQLTYKKWLIEIERYDISEDTILVGYSCGAGFLVRWLSECTGQKVGKVVLVAPWLDPSRSMTKDFFEFNIDPYMATKTQGITIFNSDNDMEDINKSLDILKGRLKDVRYRLFSGYGHFCYQDMKTDRFPELLEEILR